MMSLITGDGRVVSANVELADSYVKKVVGLMFRRSFDGALVFDMGRETYDGIHMLFVRFPIDVVFLSPDKDIVDLKKNLRPWIGTAFPKSRFRYAIELPSGTIDRLALKTGTKLDW
jgi:uncharacterized membrane protein (UPF0127 family)